MNLKSLPRSLLMAFLSCIALSAFAAENIRMDFKIDDEDLVLTLCNTSDAKTDYYVTQPTQSFGSIPESKIPSGIEIRLKDQNNAIFWLNGESPGGWWSPGRDRSDLAIPESRTERVTLEGHAKIEFRIPLNSLIRGIEHDVVYMDSVRSISFRCSVFFDEQRKRSRTFESGWIDIHFDPLDESRFLYFAMAEREFRESGLDFRDYVGPSYSESSNQVVIVFQYKPRPGVDPNRDGADPRSLKVVIGRNPAMLKEVSFVSFDR